MFKFKKVRGPEEIGEAITTLEDTANRLESMVETAQKEKSRLHLLVGNVTDRVNQIKQTASTFEESAVKITDFETSLRKLESEVKSIQKDAEYLKEMRNDTAGLAGEFGKLKAQLTEAEAKLQTFQQPIHDLDEINKKIAQLKTGFVPDIESISRQQAQLLEKYAGFAERFEQAELKLKNLTAQSEEFKKTTENVARESARITTWMAATEKMSEKLEQASGVFETTKQKIDRLHELAEYVENKTKSLKKQKELLKNAHIESGRANGLFWEIKSKLSELEQDVEKVRQMEMRTAEFDGVLKRIESRFEQINNFGAKIDRLLVEYVKLGDYAKELRAHQKEFSVIDELSKQLQKQIEQAREEHVKLNKSSEQVSLFIKRSEESQNESRTIMRQMAELTQNAEKFFNRAPDVARVVDQIEAIRKKSLVLENKLMETMATATEIKDQSEQAAEIKSRVEQFQSEVDRKSADQKKELELIKNSITSVKANLESVNANWARVPEIMAQLSEVEKLYRHLDKTYKAVVQREQIVMNLKELMEQNSEAFKKIEQTAAEIHQKATEIINFRSGLENIEYKITTLETSAKQASMLGERIEKAEGDINGIIEKSGAISLQMAEWQQGSAALKTECENLQKSQENLRLDAGEIMDLFSQLADLRSLADEKSKALDNFMNLAEQRFNELNDVNSRSRAQSEKHIKQLGSIKESIESLANGQTKLAERYNSLETDSDRISSLGNAIKEKQMELASLSEKMAVLDKRAAASEELQDRFDTFEKGFENLHAEMNTLSGTLTDMQNVKAELDSYHELADGLEKKIASIAKKAETVDKIKKDLAKATLLTEELKARQSSLADEEALINKAIMAASKLEELIYKAEHIKIQE